ncbi:MAG: hypothetical protein WDO70_11045 [Alphaproteobacteria bacterium]
MLHAPQAASPDSLEEAAVFISENGQLVLLSQALSAAPKSYALTGQILTIYDESHCPMHQRFTLGASAIESLRAGYDLIVAEIEEKRPVRITDGLHRLR